MKAAAHFNLSPERQGGRADDLGYGGVGPVGSAGGVGGFGGKWLLYDEKYILSGKGMYDSKSPQTWLQNLRDYLAGRSADIDGVLDWAEGQSTEIPMVPDQRPGQFPMIDIPAPAKEISRQLWAFLSPLVANDASRDSTFKNVARHNGLEAWRQIALPINEDKILILQELLPIVTNPKPAQDINHYDEALRNWNTNLRLFAQAGGQKLSGEAQKLAFTKLLPHDVAAHVTLHMDLPQYRTYEALKIFTDKYVKVMTSLDRQRRGQRAAPQAVRLVDNLDSQGEEDGYAIDGLYEDEEGFSYPELDNLDVDQRVEVLAFMRARGFTPAGRNAGGRFVKRPGGRGQSSGPVREAPREMPPRSRADMTCVNCNRKGHSASECRQPRVEKKDRKCFLCNKPGHEAKSCPNKGQSQPVKAIEDAPRRVPVLAVTEKPKVQQPQFGDFIRSTAQRTSTSNRFRPLTVGDWQEIASEVSCRKSPEDINPVLVDPSLDFSSFPSLHSPVATVHSGMRPPSSRPGGDCLGTLAKVVSGKKADVNISRGGYEHPSARMYRTNINSACAIAMSIEKKHASCFEKSRNCGDGGLRTLAGMVEGRTHRRSSEECWDLQERALGTLTDHATHTLAS